MFSDPIDSSSSDTESFAEDEMYGSDANVETISLKPDSMEPLPDQASTVAASDGMEDAGLMSETEEMCMDLKDIKLMASALCETEQVNVSQMTGETEDTSDIELVTQWPGVLNTFNKREDSCRLIHYYPYLPNSVPVFIMPRKNTFTIPMGDVIEVVSKTTKSKQGLRTTVKEVPFHSSKQKQSGQASQKAKKKATVVEAQSSKDPTDGMHESDIQLVEPYETDIQDFRSEDTQPQPHISVPVIGDGGFDKGSKVFHVHQFNADQVL
ncbi:hypothetical protein EDB85DRAFT_1892800 [Lactarius pseudohatsudake]|nr:hypothetical protein EDB85DRAFT_1892800 [Lactarius pseudohatsudake]